MIEKHGPYVQTHTEAVYLRLLECVLVEQTQELEDREVGVELNSLEVRGYKPEEEVTAFGQESESRKSSPSLATHPRTCTYTECRITCTELQKTVASKMVLSC